MTTTDEHVEVNAEWAYWINPETLRMNRVRGSVPIGVLVLVKSNETAESGMTFVSTQYMVARSEGLISINKKEANGLISRQILNYMKRTKRWPPNCEMGRSFKNGDVELKYQPSSYDSFPVKFTQAMVGEEVDMFLGDLLPAEELPESPPLQWRVEPAKSSRATCRSCGRAIEKGSLRLGEPSLYQEHVTYSWHHIKCASHILRHLPLERIDGLDALSVEQSAEFDSQRQSTY